MSTFLFLLLNFCKKMIFLIKSQQCLCCYYFYSFEKDLLSQMIERILTEDQNSSIRLKARKQNKYFKKVYLTVTAAAKMLNHACFGQPKEVMGLLQGFYQEKAGDGYFQVTDVIALPVEASETRVTADDQTYGLMAIHSQWISKLKTHNIMGWYHSHPSYGCWLSGIDVDTSERHQMMNDPFLAIVVDPIKSINFQKLDIGAFRVYPNKYREEGKKNDQDVPRRKAVDFGYHYQRYYQLPIELVTDDTGKKTLRNIQSIQWSSQLANSSFFNQLQYLTEEVQEEKLDIQEYFDFLEQNSTIEEKRSKKQSTLKKVSYYAKQRNISLLDSSIKTMLF